MSSDLERLGLELLALVGVAALALAVVVRRRRIAWPAATAIAVSVVTVFVALGHVAGDVRTLARDAQVRVSARQGVDNCLGDVASADSTGFIEWARARMGAKAVYSLVVRTAYPDPWCVSLDLLPALMAGPGDERPGWEVVIGGFSAQLRSLIAHHDRSVDVFSPGFALVRRPTR